MNKTKTMIFLAGKGIRIELEKMFASGSTEINQTYPHIEYPYWPEACKNESSL